MSDEDTIYRLLEFTTNKRAKPDQSPLKSQVKIDDKSIIVFPARGFEQVFQTPGLYWVEIEMHVEATFLFAKSIPIFAEDAMGIINELSAFALESA